jgi:hypothetical protein
MNFSKKKYIIIRNIFIITFSIEVLLSLLTIIKAQTFLLDVLYNHGFLFVLKLIHLLNIEFIFKILYILKPYINVVDLIYYLDRVSTLAFFHTYNFILFIISFITNNLHLIFLVLILLFFIDLIWNGKI